MTSLSTKTAALEALRRELGGKVRSGTDFLRQCELREAGPALTVVGEGGLGDLVAGLRRGRLTEILAPGPSCGGGLFLASLLERARREGHYAMLLDVGSGFSVESFPERNLESLLWVGCDSVAQAVAVFDVAARDENFRWFFLDGRDCAAEDWRTVRPAQWQRVARQLRERETAGIILARGPVTSVAKDRLELISHLDLDGLHRDRAAVAESLRFRRAEAGGRAAETRMAG